MLGWDDAGRGAEERAGFREGGGEVGGAHVGVHRGLVFIGFEDVEAAGFGGVFVELVMQDAGFGLFGGGDELEEGFAQRALLARGGFDMGEDVDFIGC